MFRVCPPLDIINSFLQSFHLNTVEDNRWFSKEDIDLESVNIILPQIEPYYLPCKAKRYLHGEISLSKSITILKHVLKANNIDLNTQEKSINGKKTTIYQIYLKKENTVIRFD